jgi:hypothetical protein
MGLIADLNPTNYKEEKDRFLADPTFNPQFQYSRKFADEELLSKGSPTDEYTQLAQKILDAALENFTVEELTGKKGKPLSREQVTDVIEDFLGVHHLDTRFTLKWSENFVSRTSVTDDNVIKLRLPSAVYKHDLESLIYHEIGTHAIRRVNYEQQPWYKKKKRYGFSPYIKTEEGLAILHSSLPNIGGNIYAYKTAVNYLAVSKAQEASFLEVWQLIKQYVNDEETAFSITFKKKRGLTDTSQPGGFTKDLVYLEGFAEVTRFLIGNDFPLKELYFGKLAYQDINKAVELNPKFEPVLPIFYTQDPESYQQRVKKIAQANFMI